MTPLAILFSYDPETGEHSADPLGVHSSGLDPVSWAYALKDSVEGDLPGRLWAVASNDEAQELRRDASSKRSASAAQAAASGTSQRYPQWKVELFRAGISERRQSPSGQMSARPMRAPGA